MSGTSGYSNQKKLGRSQFQTVHNFQSDRYGINTAQMYLFDYVKWMDGGVSTPLFLQADALELADDPNKVQLNFSAPYDGLRPGDIVKIKQYPWFDLQLEICEVVDSQNVIVLNTFPEAIVPFTKYPTGGCSVGLYRWTVATSDENGGLNVVTQPGPTQIVKDGVAVNVTKDTISPAGTIGMPVEIVAASGTPINITAGDLNVQLSDGGANPDCVKIGDGTGVYLDIFPTGQAQVRDEYVFDLINTTTNITLGSINSIAGNSLTKLSSIDTKVATAANQSTANTSLASIDGKLTGVATAANQSTTNTTLSSIDTKVATAANQTTANTSLASIDTKVATAANQSTANTSLASIDTKLSGVATSAKQDAEAVLIGAVNETAPASDTASSGLNGRLQRIAQRITSLIALFPTSIGQKTGAGSLSVVLASDQGTIPTSSTPQTQTGTITSAQKTVGTSAVRATVAGTAPSASRKKLMIKPSANNSGKIYLGSSGVTTSTGMEIIGPDRLEFPLDGSDYYVISDTASQIVEIIEVV